MTAGLPSLARRARWRAADSDDREVLGWVGARQGGGELLGAGGSPDLEVGGRADHVRIGDDVGSLRGCWHRGWAESPRCARRAAAPSRVARSTLPPGVSRGAAQSGIQRTGPEPVVRRWSRPQAGRHEHRRQHETGLRDGPWPLPVLHHLLSQPLKPADGPNFNDGHPYPPPFAACSLLAGRRPIACRPGPLPAEPPAPRHRADVIVQRGPFPKPGPEGVKRAARTDSSGPTGPA